MNDPIALNIRKATTNDCKTILGLITELAEYEKLAHEVVATVEILEESLFGESPCAEALIGEVDGNAVAYAIYFFNFSTFTGRPGIYLEDIFVQPQYRGHGFGTNLLSQLAKIALEKRCTRIEWSVLDWNEPSIKFYRSIGAVPMDEWTVQRLSGEDITSLADKF